MNPLISLEQAPSAALVVWDVDGTLTRRDTLLPFLRLVVGPAHWPRVLAKAALTAAVHTTPRSFLKVQLLRSALAGRDEIEILEAAHSFARRIEDQLCRPDALQRWTWHQARGDRQVLASASPLLYLNPLGKSLGASDVLATELQLENGHLTGEIMGANCRGSEKARKVREVISATRPAEVWVYSDSRSDAPSFDLAQIARRVRPWSKIPAIPLTVRDGRLSERSMK